MSFCFGTTSLETEVVSSTRNQQMAMYTRLLLVTFKKQKGNGREILPPVASQGFCQNYVMSSHVLAALQSLAFSLHNVRQTCAAVCSLTSAIWHTAFAGSGSRCTKINSPL